MTDPTTSGHGNRSTAPADGPAAVLSPADAYRRFSRGDALLVRLPQVNALRVTGPDRVDFVHGQVSNDVRGLPVGGTAESLLLNHKGHALAQARIVRREADLYLAVEAGAGGLVQRRFEEHIIFDQVELEDLGAEIGVLTVQGHGDAVAAALAGIGSDVPATGGTTSVTFGEARILVTPGPRSSGAGVDVHVLVRHLPEVREALAAAGAGEAAPEVLPLLRVMAGIPHAASEGGEGVLPQEAGLEPLVSYRKGCYLGQEIMARIEARGAVRKSLVGVVLAGEPAGRDVVVGERVVGRLGTSARHPDLGWLGLAVVRDDVVSDEPAPEVPIGAGGVAATFRTLPWAEEPA